ncbi:MAG: cation diffusion facilitator family transporter [Anaeroplasma sp.]
METKEIKKTIVKIGVVTIIWNAILSIGKLIAGTLAKSSSLISDAIHSASDVFSTIVVMIGAKLSTKEPDKEHPFGHERMESIASIILAMLLGGTALVLGYNGVIAIIDFAKGILPEKTDFIFLALVCAIISIIAKFLMYLYTIIAARKINSISLKADAYHHLSDSLSSIGSVLGIIGMIIGGYWAILDPIACIIISLFILKIAFDIAVQSINQVVDKAAPEEYEEEIKKIATTYPGIINLNSIKTRQFGNKYYIELAIAVDGNKSVYEGHKIARELHDYLENKYSNIKHCMIHVDPAGEENENE